MTRPRPVRQSPVAIIGIGCRLPGGVSDPHRLFDFLSANGDGVRDVPADRFSLDLHFDPDDGPDKVYVARGGFLDQDPFTFDPTPFGISPREADHLDPQQRLLLEVAWEACEDAGLPIHSLRGSATGVFVGGFMLDTQTLALDPDNRPLVSQHTSTGVTMTVLANRLSHTFDLRGPSLTVDTACSASLVATHLACQSLADGACDLALAGGANVILTNGGTLIMCKGKFLAPDGRSKAFEASADGYGRGEGAGIVLLKRLEDAVRDGDRIYAVIRGTGINQDGRTEGMAFPSGEAQARLSAQVCRASGIDPTQVAYVEAHGTGTRAGDPIEVRALAATYGGERAHPLLIGSIKSNVGHLEAGAGVTGLIKVAVAIARGTVLPQRTLVQPNPDIPFDELGLRVVEESTAWPDAARRIAGVNSFGYGGTNAHALVSDVDSALRDLGLAAPTPSAPAPAPDFVCVSADSEGALRSHARQLAARIGRDPELALEDVAYTLATHRSHRSFRAVAVAEGRDELLAALEAASTGEPHPALVTGRAARPRRVLWTFTGMGPQWWGMAHELYAEDAAFRAAAEAADRVFTGVAGWSILEEMLRDEASSRMPRNDIAQPANLVLQLGLCASLRARGLRADGFLGHSVGELAAAYAAGCIDMRQAVVIAYHRSQLQQTVAGGAMLAAAISAEHAARLIADQPVEIAAYNAANSVALAGDRRALEALGTQLEAEGVFSRLMPVEVAYHSRHMDPVERGFRERLGFVAPAAPTAPLYSTLTGARVTGVAHDAEYWWSNARQPVLLHRALRAALDDGYELFVEIGPHPVLKMAIRDTLRETGRDGISLHALHRQSPAIASVRRLVAGVHASGGRVELPPPDPRRLVDLPRYAFDRQRHWVESEASRQRRLGRDGAHPLLQRKEPAPTPRWTSDLSAWALRWIREHQVDGRAVLPGAAHVEALLAAAAERLGDDVTGTELVVEDLRLTQPLVLDPGAPSTLRVEVEADGLARISSASSPDQWTLHATARLHDRARFGAPAEVDLTGLRARLRSGPTRSEVYHRLEAMGLRYGGVFRSLQHVRCGHGELLAELAVPEAPGYRLHPATLDGAFQALLTLQLEAAPGGPIVPVAIDRVRLLRPVRGPRVLAHGRAERRPDGSVLGDIAFLDDQGQVLAEVRRVLCRAVRPSSTKLGQEEHRWFHTDAWRPADAALSPPSGRWLLVGPDSPLARSLLDELGSTVPARRVEPGRPWPADAAPTQVVALPHQADYRACLAALADTVRRAAGQPRPPRVCVITRGAFASPASADIAPVQTAVAGLARVAMTEHPELHLRLVDVPSALPASAAVIAGCAAGTTEEELVAARSGVLARRIVRTGPENKPRREARRHYEPGDPPVELVVEAPGKLDSLAYRPLAAEALAEDEVEVEVEAASLNFKDVMKAMGMLSRTALQRTYLGDGLGMEAVGRVVRTGGAVDHVAAGDYVYLWRGGCLATRARARAPFVFKLDEDVDPIEACCRFVFLTAWHGLIEAGRLAPGERVLIHSAAGGVGLAAVQIAQQRGAEIFATAGTEDKRAYLRSLGLAHVYDSRTLDFADHLRRDTGGDGVDVVLNALAGPAQRASLELLRDGGRFVEIGKQDIAAGTHLSLLAFNRALSFVAVDLDRLSSSREALCGGLAREVWQAFATGALRPLPTEVFPASRAGDAFRRLGGGQVIGKVAIDFRGQTLTVAPGLSPAATIRPDATYLVTGGLGGFGLRTARWLVERGARHLVLASRRGAPPSAEDARIVDELRAAGAAVQCLALDICDETAVRTAIAAVDRPEAPLRGVFHSAMVLDDRPIAALNAASIARVCGPKIDGALHLHRATLDRALDLFVTYSSVSAMIGNPGQAAYAAANAFLDGLAAHRRHHGLPGLAVSWGALGEAGVVARDEGVRRHLEAMGLRPLAPSRALVALARALEEGFDRVGILDIDWSRWRKATAPTPWRRLDEIAGGTGEGDDSAGVRAQLARLEPGARRGFVEQRIATAVGAVLRLPTDRVDAERPLADYGVDSLMAVELQVALEQAVGVEFSTMELLAGRNLRRLAERALAELTGLAAAPPHAASAGATPVDGPALRAHFLERICVQPPYFALDELRLEDAWVHASVVPAPAPAAELGAIGIAEAARHLAILGSCAVRQQSAAVGRIYYPVRSAQLVAVTAAIAPPQGRVHVRARCLQLDPMRAEARALAEVLSSEGERLACFEIGYHVIPEEQFQALFSDRARPTGEVDGGDPYRNVDRVPAPRRDGDRFTVGLGAIDARRCLGHFVGYPAYPVSIMARDAVQLVAEAVRQRHRRPDLRVRVTGGAAGTAAFVFAGATASLTARPIPSAPAGADADREWWRVEVVSDGEVAAWFDMEIAVIESLSAAAALSVAS